MHETKEVLEFGEVACFDMFKFGVSNNKWYLLEEKPLKLGYKLFSNDRVYVFMDEKFRFMVFSKETSFNSCHPVDFFKLDESKRIITLRTHFVTNHYKY